jgi:hypothetical protein
MARARHDLLGVQVVGVVVVGVEQPLVVVQVEDVLLERAGVDVADLGEVARVTVMDVGGVLLEEGVVVDEAAGPVVHADRGIGYVDGVTPAGLNRRDITIPVKFHNRVAHRLRGEEELLVGAVGAVVHGARVQAVGDDLRADAA